MPLNRYAPGCCDCGSEESADCLSCGEFFKITLDGVLGAVASEADPPIDCDASWSGGLGCCCADIDGVEIPLSQQSKPSHVGGPGGGCHWYNTSTTRWGTLFCNGELDVGYLYLNLLPNGTNFDVYIEIGQAPSGFNPSHLMATWTGTITGTSCEPCNEVFSNTTSDDACDWTLSTASLSQFSGCALVARVAIVVPTVTHTLASSESVSPLSVTATLVAPTVICASSSSEEVSPLAVNATIVPPAIANNETENVSPLSMQASIVAPMVTAVSPSNEDVMPIGITAAIVAPTIVRAQAATESVTPGVVQAAIVVPIVTNVADTSETPMPTSITAAIVTPTVTIEQAATETPLPLTTAVTFVTPTVTSEAATTIQVIPCLLDVTIVPPVVTTLGGCDFECTMEWDGADWGAIDAPCDEGCRCPTAAEALAELGEGSMIGEQQAMACTDDV